MSDEKFESWAVVDLFGHQRIAGRISEFVFGGETFVRIDVPEIPTQPAHTQLYGKGAIYRMALTSQEIAEGVARRIQSSPVTVYDFDEETKARMRALPAPASASSQSMDDDDDFDDQDDEEEF